MVSLPLCLIFHCKIILKSIFRYSPQNTGKFFLSQFLPELREFWDNLYTVWMRLGKREKAADWLLGMNYPIYIYILYLAPLFSIHPKSSGAGWVGWRVETPFYITICAAGVNTSTYIIYSLSTFIVQNFISFLLLCCWVCVCVCVFQKLFLLRWKVVAQKTIGSI